LVFGRRPLGAILYSSNKPGELSQWLWHDDSTIIIIIINHLMGKLKPHSNEPLYSNTVIGTLAVDG